jgi:hypothetical protein
VPFCKIKYAFNLGYFEPTQRALFKHTKQLRMISPLDPYGPHTQTRQGNFPCASHTHVVCPATQAAEENYHPNTFQRQQKLNGVKMLNF